ncbi:MAG: hypothetical protein CR968_05790 [Flavobacteriia bacterium]|nr:MAG: hypothetical protein CR968_05790 [Flavobacteriia bacterium]
MLDFITIIDHLGTFAFALSGLRLASYKNFDLFGAYVIGLITAIGGGTTRDLLLNETPFWMTQPSYLVITGIALLGMMLFSGRLVKLKKTLFLFDAIGLGLFVVVGLEKTLDLGFPIWVAITMGMITGTVGGVIRDVLINEIPLLFRRDVYALTCIAGGIVYYIGFKMGLNNAFTGALAASSIIVFRVVAVKYHIQMPTLKSKH